jgi:hypothetical protein
MIKLRRGLTFIVALLLLATVLYMYSTGNYMRLNQKLDALKTSMVNVAPKVGFFCCFNLASAEFFSHFLLKEQPAVSSLLFNLLTLRTVSSLLFNLLTLFYISS